MRPPPPTESRPTESRRPEGEALDWLRDAWRRLTYEQPDPPDPILRDAIAFLNGVVPRDRAEAGVVWLIARRRWPRSAPPFPHDAWIGFAAADVYTDFEGRGYGTRRLIRLLERWARWAHGTGRVDRAVMDDLLGDLDHARELHGFQPRRAARPRPLGEHGLRFALRGIDERIQDDATLALRLAWAYLDRVQGRPGRLHALDPEAFALEIREALREAKPRPGAPTAACLVAGAGDAFAHLDGSPHLPHPLGAHLAKRLGELAMGLR